MKQKGTISCVKNALIFVCYTTKLFVIKWRPANKGGVVVEKVVNLSMVSIVDSLLSTLHASANHIFTL